MTRTALLRRDNTCRADRGSKHQSCNQEGGHQCCLQGQQPASTEDHRARGQTSTRCIQNDLRTPKRIILHSPCAMESQAVAPHSVQQMDGTQCL
jgi:hypothetical protein